MSKFFPFYLITWLLITISVSAQNDLMWNTRIFPDSNFTNASVQSPEKDFQFNANPMVSIFGNTTYTVYPNLVIHPSGGKTSQSETTIAINPVNTDILLAGTNSANSAATYINQGWYATTNGGSAWYGSDSLPHKPAGFFRSDPVTGFDLDGNMYFSTLEYSTTACDVVILKSTDNGINWTKTAIANSGIDEDKPWLAVDQNPSSPFKNYIYAAYTEFGVTNPSPLEFSRSTDGGATFSFPIVISGSSGRLQQGINFSVSNNGDLVGCYDHYPNSTPINSNITFIKSTDGGISFSSPVFIASGIYDLRAGNLVKGTSSIRVNSFPQIAVDNSSGLNSGRIYVTWAAKQNLSSAPDVYLSWSDDGGSKWITPKRVNSDSVLINRDQYFPSVDIDPADGSVNIIYYDSRNFSANDSAEVYLSRSLDGGLTFSDIKISDHAFLPSVISGLSAGYQGDYIEVVARNGILWPCWADNRTGQYQAYTAKVFFIDINHIPLANTENLNGPYRVNAKIGSSGNLSSVKLFWRRGTADGLDSVSMSQVLLSNSFYADIPGNGSPSIYQYYISVNGSNGSSAILPAGAPLTLFSFEAAADTVRPIIAHDILQNQYREEWPAVVSASATDNIGVDSVWVEYKLKNAGDLLRFNLLHVDGSAWSGTFEIDTTIISLGDTLLYRISARDNSNGKNIGFSPSQNSFHSFTFISDTVGPVIVHKKFRDYPIARWPGLVSADVRDRFGILKVSAQVKINSHEPVNFSLIKESEDSWTALFPFNPSELNAGDTIYYRLIAADNSTAHNISYLPASGYYNFKVISAKAVVLVVNDDVSLEGRYSVKSGIEGVDLVTPLSSSSNLITDVLKEAGYSADSVTFSGWDVSNLSDYDIVVLSAGTKTTTQFNDQAKRSAVINYNLAGGKVFIEGGEVGWIYRYTASEVDPLFRRTILKDSTWISDNTSGILKKRVPYHSVWTYPNFIRDSLAFVNSGWGSRDVVSIMKNNGSIYKLGSWLNYPDSAGIIAYSPTMDTNYVTNIFCTFALGDLADQTAARKLIENLFEYMTSGWSTVPVELTAFNAAVSVNGVNLTWQTATEINNSGFEIERRSENSAYRTIGFIHGKGTSTTLSNYSFIDKDLISGQYYYRLRQVDYNGKADYSDEVLVDYADLRSFELSQNYPNPFNPYTIIKFIIPNNAMVVLNVYNLLGEKVTSLLNGEMKAGKYEVSFDAAALPSGLYIYKIEAGSYSSVKKMLFLK